MVLHHTSNPAVPMFVRWSRTAAACASVCFTCIVVAGHCRPALGQNVDHQESK